MPKHIAVKAEAARVELRKLIMALENDGRWRQADYWQGVAETLYKVAEEENKE